MKTALNPLREGEERSLSFTSSNMSLSLTNPSQQQYEYVGFDVFPPPKTTRNPHNMVPTKSNRGFEQEIPDGLDVKDMLTSSYDNKIHMSVWKIMLAAAIGAGIGIALVNAKVPTNVAQWILLPGDLFINALKCLIVPMVFCSVVTCIGELMAAGKAAAIGGRAVMYFVMASLTSSSLGTAFGAAFQHLFKAHSHTLNKHIAPELAISCSNGNYLTQLANGLLTCAVANTSEIETNDHMRLALNDTTKFFALAQSKYDKLSVTDQVFGILFDLIPSNITDAFAKGSTLSVISFAILFGVAVIKSVENASHENHALLLVTHLNILFRMLINAVVKYIPFAIVSLIAGSMAQYSASTALLESVGYLILVLALALITLVIGIMGTVLFLTTRRNIFTYLRHIVPAQVFIFGCSSSIATLPMTMRCVDATREVSHALSRFILSVGATSNLNGTAVYMPLACIFMAKVGGFEDQLTPLAYIMLALVGAIASFGVAPVPHSGLVMVITVWRTVFGIDVPPVFSLLVGADWILNRMRAIVNITNDTIIVRIIADQCDETTIQELHDDYDDGLSTPP